MKLLKKNQIIIYVIALMLVTAGYLNYTAKGDTVETSLNMVETNTAQIADVGDATLVSSNDIAKENKVVENQVTEETANATNTAQETKQTGAENVKQDEYFVKSKLERDNMYSQMIGTYQKMLENTSIPETQKSVATKEIAKINETKNSIMICENLITTKGITNSVIFVNNESISVILQKTEITQEEIAQVQNIVSREMKAEIEQIHITNK